MWETLSDPAIQAIIGLSLQVALAATLVVLPLAILVSHLLAKPRFPAKSLLSALVHLPLVLPPVATGYVLLLLFGRNGPVGAWLDGLGLQVVFSWTGAAIAAGVMAFPLIVRPIRLAFESRNTQLDEMAESLGAGRWRRFYSITLPLAWPGIISGFILGFAKALGEFGATITFVSNIPGETQTLSLAIYTLLQSPSGDQKAFALIAIAIAISFLAVLLSEWMARRIAKRRER